MNSARLNNQNSENHGFMTIPPKITLHDIYILCEMGILTH